MSDREITADLMARLRRHYIKPGERIPTGVFLPEIGWNGTAKTSRCDALYIGFSSASGRLLVGHEVKASRADWLNELRKLDKADDWADQCHQWWLVTVPGVVRDGELPASWGLMLPGPSKTRMRIEVKAHTFEARTPNWDTARSITHRLEVLHRDTIAAQLAKATEQLNATFDQRVEASAKWRAANVNTSEELQEKVDRMEAALGGRLMQWASGSDFTEAELQLAGRWIRARRRLDNSGRHLSQPHVLQGLRRQLDAVGQALADLDVLERQLAEVAAPLERPACASSSGACRQPSSYREAR